jgi:hypothetical protein
MLIFKKEKKFPVWRNFLILVLEIILNLIIITIITTERKTWNNNIILNLSNNLFYFYFHLLFLKTKSLKIFTFRFSTFKIISLKIFYFPTFRCVLLFWRRRFPWKFSLLGLGQSFLDSIIQKDYKLFKSQFAKVNSHDFPQLNFTEFWKFSLHFPFKKIRKLREKFFTFKIIFVEIFTFSAFRFCFSLSG